MEAQGGDWKSDYVQNGILMWLDGEHNSTDGTHDSNLVTWIDQSGNGYDWNMSGTFEVKPKSIAVNGAGYGTLPSSVSLPTGDFIEIVLMQYVYPSGTNDAQSILNGYGNVTAFPRAIYANTTNNHNLIVFGASTNSKGIVSPGLNQCFYCNSSLYLNGQIVPKYNGYQSWSGTGKWLFKYKTSFMFKGEVFAIRVYNRVLTEAEILRNFAADQKRFGIEVSV